MRQFDDRQPSALRQFAAERRLPSSGPAAPHRAMGEPRRLVCEPHFHGIQVEGSLTFTVAR